MDGKFVEVEADSREEGLKLGAERLGIAPDLLSVEILEEKKKGFFGKGKTLKLKVFPKNPSSERDFLLGGGAEPAQETGAPAPASNPTPLPAPQTAPAIPPAPAQETAAAPAQAAETPHEEESGISGEITGDCAIYSFDSAGLSITIFPPTPGEPPVEFVQVLEEVNTYGFISVDLDAMATAVEKPGSKVKIAPPQPKKIILKRSIKVDEHKSSFVEYEMRPDGVYATYHFMGGKPLELNTLLSEVKGKGILETDMNAVTTLLEEPGRAFKIAPPQPKEVLKDGEIVISVSPDEMQAVIQIFPPFGGRPITPEDVLKSIEANGIIIKPDESQLAEVVATGRTNRVSLTLWGIKPQPGSDAKVQILFGGEKEKTGPVELEDGRVDYREVGAIESVSKGQVIAQKTPASLGTPGQTVKGREIPPIVGRDVPLPHGKGTELSPDGLQLLAAIDGCPVMEGAKVAVLPVYEVKGDVNFSTGNIDFIGNVVIRGNVTSGFVVKAAGNVDVFGNVEDAYVDSAGKVTVRGGAYGRGKAQVIAGDDIAVRFAENATLKSKGTLKIGEHAVHSRLTANKKILVGGKKGLIVGGLARAGEEVKCRNIGNHLATPTEVEVGVNPEEREELKALEKKVELDQENLNKTQRAIEGLKQIQAQVGELPPPKKDLLIKLTRTQFQLMGQLKQAVERKVQLEEALKQATSGRVAASDKIFPGTKITIKRAVLLVSEELKFVSLFEKNDEVKAGTFK